MAEPAAPAPRWRLFIGVPVPPAAALELWTELAPVRARHPHVRWARVEQLHATLVFLGQTETAEATRLELAMAEAARRCGSFEVSTADAGGRVDDRRGGVAWLRVDAGAEQVRLLSIELDRLIGSNAYAGGAPRPHITVARRIDEPMLADLRAHAGNVRARWTADRIVLYRSQPAPGGSRYQTIAEQALKQ